MVKDVYLFTNGKLMVFGDNGEELAELSKDLTLENKKAIESQFGDGTRITLARWRKGFFVLTREEFMTAEFEDDFLTIKFKRKSESVEVQ